MENIKNIESLVSSHPDPVSLMLMIKAAGDSPLFTQIVIKNNTGQPLNNLYDGSR
jgi:hypothetical protein